MTPPMLRLSVLTGVALSYSSGGCPFPSWCRYVALPPGRYASGAACGTYLEIPGGPKGEVRVEVVGLCSGCGYRHINLSRAAFDEICD
jgi:expansin